jgi:hypothetical protein
MSNLQLNRFNLTSKDQKLIRNHSEMIEMKIKKSKTGNKRFKLLIERHEVRI